MRKPSPHNLKTLAAATLWLLFVSAPAYAYDPLPLPPPPDAARTDNDLPIDLPPKVAEPAPAPAAPVVKSHLLLLPLQADGIDAAVTGSMQAALEQGFGKQFDIVTARQINQPPAPPPPEPKTKGKKRKKVPPPKECNDAACLKKAALNMNAGMYAAVQVSKAAQGFVLTLDIRDIQTEQSLSYISLTCNGCGADKAAEMLGEMSGAPAMASQQLPPGSIFRDCPDCPDMVAIPSGSFDMGSLGSGQFDEKPEHHVTVNQGFAIGRMEITRGQYAAYLKAAGLDTSNMDDKCWALSNDKWDDSAGYSWRNPGFAQDDSHPATCVSWIDAQGYVKWLSDKTGEQYRLPTEAEWEYACRADQPTNYCGGDAADSVAWYDQNSSGATHPAGSKQPNRYGLYDMSGNVAEWVEDSYHKEYIYAPSTSRAWVDDRSRRVLRGGSWLYSDARAHATFRTVSAPGYRYVDSGFRVVRMLPQ